MNKPNTSLRERYRLYEEDSRNAEMMAEPERSIELLRLVPIGIELTNEFRNASPKLSSVDRIKERFNLFLLKRTLKGDYFPDADDLREWIDSGFAMPFPVFEDESLNRIVAKLKGYMKLSPDDVLSAILKKLTPGNQLLLKALLEFDSSASLREVYDKEPTAWKDLPSTIGFYDRLNELQKQLPTERLVIKASKAKGGSFEWKKRNLD